MEIRKPKPRRELRELLKQHLVVVAGVLMALGAPLSARADTPARDVEALMADYLRLWNAHDAHAVWTRVYRLDAAQPMRSEADLAATFAQLKAQGYDHSDLQSIHACLLTPQTAIAVMRFSRLKADGTPLPPRDRASLYMLRRFDDGWRVTSLSGMNASARIDCASAEPGR